MYADLVIQICNIQLSISQKIPTIPPIWASPLVCGGKMAISVCFIIPDSSPVVSKLSLLINYLLGKRLGLLKSPF